MTLSSMIVSRDWAEVSVLECILGGMQISVDVEPRPERARAKLASSKCDALIIDCDLGGTDQVMEGLTARPNQTSMPVAFMSRPHGFPKLEKAGASFLLQKPISVEHAVHTLSAARNNIVGGRLRYHRASLELPIAISYAPGKKQDASLLNLSQGGLGFRAKKPLPIASRLEISLALPGSQPFKVPGKVVWTDVEGNAGVKFLPLGAPAKKELQLWLERQYFAH